MVSKYGQVGNILYLDPSTGKVFEFDHLKRTFIEETDKRQVLGETVDSYRAAIANVMEKYVNDSFKSNKANAAVYGADNGTITICVSAKNVNLGNYWYNLMPHSNSLLFMLITVFAPSCGHYAFDHVHANSY